MINPWYPIKKSKKSVFALFRDMVSGIAIFKKFILLIVAMV